MVRGLLACSRLSPDLAFLSSMAEPQTHCPNCGTKLPEKPLSLCAYCAMPLGLDSKAKAEGGESPNAGRIKRVSEHENFEGAMGWDPPEGMDYVRGQMAQLRAKFLLGIGALLLAGGFFLGGGFTHPLSIAAYLCVPIAAWLFVQGSSAMKSAVALPLLKRAALITDRRSDTKIQGWGGATTYYFAIEFEDGVEGEFAYPGHGSNEEPYVSNLPGVAYTRGQRLLAFKHIRV